MLKAKDLKALLEDVPDETEITCMDALGVSPIKRASYCTKPAAQRIVILCPMGAHLSDDLRTISTAHSLPVNETAIK